MSKFIFEDSDGSLYSHARLQSSDRYRRCVLDDREKWDRYVKAVEALADARTAVIGALRIPTPDEVVS